MVESSEEFTVSGDFTSASTEQSVEATSLHLSNMVIVEEQATTTTTPSKPKVQFNDEPYFITEQDTFVPPPLLKKKRSKRHALNEQESGDEQQEEEPEVLPQELWYSQQELQSTEQNAMYLVKESQQYQEEVICTVLYNKAFLSAANLGKETAEDELSELLQDVTKYSNTLEQWTAVGNCRRGLENMVSEKAVVDAAQSRMLVLAFQQELKESSDESISVHADFLAKRCQDTSRTSRIMARMMGQADMDSLLRAEELATDVPSLPEPPGRFSGDHEYQHMSQRIPADRRSRRSSIMKGVKKVFGVAFRRRSTMDASIRRIQKIQARRAEEESENEPPRRLSQEFRRSFLESLGYGPQ